MVQQASSAALYAMPTCGGVGTPLGSAIDHWMKQSTRRHSVATIQADPRVPAFRTFVGTSFQRLHVIHMTGQAQRGAPTHAEPRLTTLILLRYKIEDDAFAGIPCGKKAKSFKTALVWHHDSSSTLIVSGLMDTTIRGGKTRCLRSGVWRSIGVHMLHSRDSSVRKKWGLWSRIRRGGIVSVEGDWRHRRPLQGMAFLRYD